MNQKKKRFVSIMFIPDDATTFQVRLRLATLKFLGIMAGVFVLLIIVGAISYWKIAEIAFKSKQVLARNTELEEENAKINELAVILQRTQEADKQIRKIAGGVVKFKSGTESAPVPASQIERNIRSRLGLKLLPGGDVQQATGGSNASRLMAIPVSFNWPIYGGWITKEFTDGKKGSEQKHQGIDIAAKIGTPVKASSNGVVSFAGWTSDFGNIIIIDHGNGLLTRYGHNSRVLVERGDIVKQGKIIAFVGSSGRSSAPHLHFEIWKDGTPVNPRDFLLR